MPPGRRRSCASCSTTPALARRARYTLGLLLVHDGREAEALPLLDRRGRRRSAGRRSPRTSSGQLRLAERPAEALEWHRRAAALQPLLRSAHYGAFLALRRLNRDDEAAAMLARFQALERNPQARGCRIQVHADGSVVGSDHGRRARRSSAAGAVRRALRFTGAARRRQRRSPGAGAGRRDRSRSPISTAMTRSICFIAGAIDGPDPNAVRREARPALRARSRAPAGTRRRACAPPCGATSMTTG